MAGRGPAAKPVERRARRNAEPFGGTVLRFQPSDQPELPAALPWPEQTKAWWAMWACAAQAEHMTATDWSFLLDTAVLHAQLWGSGDVRVLPELRIRVAKFGATPEDRARLRMTFAEADEADKGRGASGAGSFARRKAHPVKALPAGRVQPPITVDYEVVEDGEERAA